MSIKKSVTQQVIAGASAILAEKVIEELGEESVADAVLFSGKTVQQGLAEIGTTVRRTRKPKRAASKRATSKAAAAPAPEVKDAPKPEAPKAKGGKRHRASAEELQAQKAKVLEVIRTAPVPVKKGYIAGKVKFDPTHALVVLRQEEAVTMKGERKHATYTVK